MWMLKTGKPVNVPPLNDAMAIELGAYIIGEMIIFIIAATLICGEFRRKAHKDERKEATRKAELNKLYTKLNTIDDQLGQQEDQILELIKAIRDLGNRNIDLKLHTKKIVDSSKTTLQHPAQEQQPSYFKSGSWDMEQSLPSASKLFPPWTEKSSSDPISPLPSVTTVKPQINESREDFMVTPSRDDQDPHISIFFLQHEVIQNNNGAVMNALAYVINEVFSIQTKHYKDVENNTKLYSDKIRCK